MNLLTVNIDGYPLLAPYEGIDIPIGLFSVRSSFIKREQIA